MKKNNYSSHNFLKLLNFSTCCLFLNWFTLKQIPFQLEEVKLYTLFFFINHTSACTWTGPRWFLSSYWPLYCLIILSGFCIYSYNHVCWPHVFSSHWKWSKKRKKGIKHEWELFVLVPSFFFFTILPYILSCMYTSIPCVHSIMSIAKVIRFSV